MGKILYKCQFGNVHKEGRCRCMSDHVETRQVKCDNVLEHGGKEMVEAEQGEKLMASLNARLTKTVDGYFANFFSSAARQELVAAIEKDVAQWFIEAAASLNNKE